MVNFTLTLFGSNPALIRSYPNPNLEVTLTFIESYPTIICKLPKT